MQRLFEIFGDIGLQGQGEVESGLAQLDSAAEQVGGSLDEMGQRLTKVGERVSDVGGKMTKWVSGPIAAVGAGLVGLISKHTSYADELSKTATELNLDIEALQEMEFALGQLTQLSDGEARRAIERLNQTIAEGTEGKEKDIETFKKLGYSQEQIVGGAIKTEEAFDRSVKALAEADTQAEATRLAMELFGRRMGRRIAPALREAGGDVQELRERFQELGLGISQEQASAAETFNDKWDEVKRQLMQTVHTVGAELLPVFQLLLESLQKNLIPMIEKFAGWVADLAEGFSNLPGPVQKFIIAALAITAAVGPVVLIIGKLITAFGLISSAIGAVLPVITGIIATLGGPLTIAILAVVAVIATFVAKWDEIKAAVQAAAQAIGGMVSSLRDAVVNAFKKMGAAISAGIDKLKGAWTSAKETTKAALEGIVQILSWMKEKFKTVFSAVYDVTVGALGKIKDWITQTAKSIFSPLADAFDWVLEKIKAGVGIFQSAWQSVKNVTSTAVNAVVGTLQSLGSSIQSIWDTIYNATIGKVQSMYNWVVGKFQAMGNKISAAMSKLSFGLVGGSIIPDMVDQIGGEFGRMNQEARGEADDMAKGVQGNLDKLHAPDLGETQIGQSQGQQGAGKGNSGPVYIDQRHAIWRDDKDMLERLRRGGVTMVGAY